jgi:hypothetical protein
MTLYDLGTHYGEGLRKVLALHPRGTFDEIYCFEPNPTIPVHVHLADIDHPKLHILKKAVLDRYDTMPFLAQKQSGQGFGSVLEGFVLKLQDRIEKIERLKNIYGDNWRKHLNDEK